MGAAWTGTGDDGHRLDRLAQQWFGALDHLRVDVGARSWVALVTGVHLDGSGAWIQIVREGSSDEDLVLHVSARTTIAEAIDAITDRCGLRAGFPRIVTAPPAS